MVIPMPAGMGAAMSGDPPEQVQGHLQKIKWTVVAVFLGSIGKLVQGGLPFNEIFYVISGIFLMKDDKITGRAYTCLLSTPLGACAGPSGGGLTCLTPVMFLGGINVLFGLFSPYLLEPFNLICIACFCCSFLFLHIENLLHVRLKNFVFGASSCCFGRRECLRAPKQKPNRKHQVCCPRESGVFSPTKPGRTCEAKQVQRARCPAASKDTRPTTHQDQRRSAPPGERGTALRPPHKPGLSLSRGRETNSAVSDEWNW
ncbi:unnamed protein product [Amoebophrya sp. A120]|nr:unnamed protein product [Amoebophrya sp. A120]|eukprot:GSA120T00011560001.1